MPLPFIPILIGAAALAAGATGVAKGIEAKDKLDRAQRYQRDAKRLADQAEQDGKQAQELLKRELTKLGQAKKDLNELCVKVEKRRKQDIENDMMDDKSKKFNKVSISVYGSSASMADVFTSMAGSLGAGAASCALALGGVVLFGTATTGTAIGSLTGAAFSSALLSWFGGGALAAGGLGVMGGAAVLGGIFLGPAILIGGFVLSSKAEEALDQARDAYYEVKEKVEKANKVINSIKNCCTQLSDYTALINRTRDSLKRMFDIYCNNSGEVTAGGLDALLYYNNILMRYIPLFDPNEDPNNPQFKFDHKFEVFAKCLKEGLDEMDRLIPVGNIPSRSLVATTN